MASRHPLPPFGPLHFEVSRELLFGTSKGPHCPKGGHTLVTAGSNPSGLRSSVENRTLRSDLTIFGKLPKATPGEHLVDIEGVAGSIPVAPTIQSSRTTETSSLGNRALSRGSCRLISTFPVSADISGLSRGFLDSRSRIKEFRSWRQLDFGTSQPALGNWVAEKSSTSCA
jgi:hypothetical protein